MSYGTRGGRRKPSGNDPTIIPSTQPIGFLSKLPWKMGGTLRYKPSAANLQEKPGKHENAQEEPLLGSDNSTDMGEVITTRKRSGTTGSGDTSDSYRSRGDLFPSDGEGEEDAVPLDDEVTYDMVRKDDRSSGKSRSSKGKRPAFGGSRTASRTTIASSGSRESLGIPRTYSGSLQATPDIENTPPLDALHMEEESLRREEEEKIAKQKEAAAQLATARGLKAASPELPPTLEPKPDVADDEVYEPQPEPEHGPRLQPEISVPLAPAQEGQNPSQSDLPRPRSESVGNGTSAPAESDEFVPARLPRFG